MKRATLGPNGLTQEQIDRIEVHAPDGATPEDTAEAKAAFIETMN